LRAATRRKHGANALIVAVALVSSGEAPTIALEECNRRAAGLGPEDRAVRLARIEQALAPPSAEKQGLGPVAHDVDRAGDPAGCASGEERYQPALGFCALV
jgi:hypothetical protein